MAWNTPSTWVAGAVLTAAQLNAQIRDNFKAIGDPWTAYSPTASAGLTIGNGTIVGAYGQTEKLTRVRIVVTLGSTSSISGNVALTLPATPVASDQVVACALNDVSAGTGGRLTASGYIPSGSATVQIWGPTGSLTSTIPFTWATGDKIIVTGIYEAA